MREVAATFEKGFQLGLAPEPNLRTQGEHMSECYNLVPNAFGVTGRESLFSLPDLVEEQWPFPAIYITNKHFLVFTSGAVYEYLPAQGTLTLRGTGVWGGLPQIADFYDTLYWSTPTGCWQYSQGAVAVVPGAVARFTSCCSFRGQLVVGNCTLPLQAGSTSVSGSGLIAWSVIGAADFIVTLGNDVGYAPTPWIGKIVGMLPLGSYIMVYGDNGIVRMSPEIEPVTTFGQEHWGRVGVLNENCVAGDDVGHVFLGTDYNLYSVEPMRAMSDAGRGPSRLGYREYLKDLVSPVVTFDPVLRQWWVGDQDKCYIFTGTGLGEASETPTHLNHYEGVLWAHSFIHGTRAAIATTNDLTMDYSGIKTLMQVDCDAICENLVYGSVDFRYNYRKGMGTTKKIVLNSRGGFTPIIAGTEFKVRLETEDFEDIVLTKATLRYKYTDKHLSRGIISAGPNAE